MSVLVEVLRIECWCWMLAELPTGQVKVSFTESVTTDSWAKINGAMKIDPDTV